MASSTNYFVQSWSYLLKVSMPHLLKVMTTKLTMSLCMLGCCLNALQALATVASTEL